jgi:hypothetical protein
MGGPGVSSYTYTMCIHAYDEGLFIYDVFSEGVLLNNSSGENRLQGVGVVVKKLKIVEGVLDGCYKKTSA